MFTNTLVLVIFGTALTLASQVDVNIDDNEADLRGFKEELSILCHQIEGSIKDYLDYWRNVTEQHDSNNKQETGKAIKISKERLMDLNGSYENMRKIIEQSIENEKQKWNEHLTREEGEKSLRFDLFLVPDNRNMFTKALILVLLGTTLTLASPVKYSSDNDEIIPRGWKDVSDWLQGVNQSFQDFIHEKYHAIIQKAKKTIESEKQKWDHALKEAIKIGKDKYEEVKQKAKQAIKKLKDELKAALDHWKKNEAHKEINTEEEEEIFQEQEPVVSQEQEQEVVQEQEQEVVQEQEQEVVQEQEQEVVQEQEQEVVQEQEQKQQVIQEQEMIQEQEQEVSEVPQEQVESQE
ncbi:uncharacterized protein LOC131666985 [Phymastichus coffea]|uniref:uncharacterized protein LOC131666985 n=1 Tax=Phymastichus coffea TaxID=108790 RepID=UPI00273C2211|nr:uncharacterized protein LOC131666985 [Phymastichus coffea]